MRDPIELWNEKPLQYVQENIPELLKEESVVTCNLYSEYDGWTEDENQYIKCQINASGIELFRELINNLKNDGIL